MKKQKWHEIASFRSNKLLKEVDLESRPPLKTAVSKGWFAIHE